MRSRRSTAICPALYAKSARAGAYFDNSAEQFGEAGRTTEPVRIPAWRSPKRKGLLSRIYSIAPRTSASLKSTSLTYVASKPAPRRSAPGLTYFFGPCTLLLPSFHARTSRKHMRVPYYLQPALAVPGKYGFKKGSIPRARHHVKPQLRPGAGRQNIVSRHAAVLGPSLLWPPAGSQTSAAARTVTELQRLQFGPRREHIPRR